MKRCLIVIVLLLFNIITNAQVKSYFGGTLNIYASSGTSPEYTIQGFFNDTSGEYPLDSVAVGDIIYVSEGSTCVRLRVDTINSSAGGILNADLFDIDTILLSPPNGIGALMRETPNSNLPRYIPGLSETLLSCIRTHMTGKVDEEISTNANLIHSSTIKDTTVSSISYIADLTDVAELRVITDLSAASSNITVQIPDPTTNIGKKVTVKQLNPTGSFATQITIDAIGNRIKLPGQTILTNVLNIPASTENEYGFTTAYDANSATYIWSVVEPNTVYSNPDGVKFYDPITSTEQKVKASHTVDSVEQILDLNLKSGDVIETTYGAVYTIGVDSTDAIRLSSSLYAKRQNPKTVFSSIEDMKKNSKLIQNGSYITIAETNARYYVSTKQPIYFTYAGTNNAILKENYYAENSPSIIQLDADYVGENLVQQSTLIRDDDVGYDYGFTRITLLNSKAIGPSGKSNAALIKHSSSGTPDLRVYHNATTAGEDFTFSGWVKKPASTVSKNYNLRADWFYSSNLNPINIPLANTTDWQYFELHVNSDNVVDRVFLDFSGSAVGDSLYFADFSISRTPYMYEKIESTEPVDEESYWAQLIPNDDGEVLLSWFDNYGDDDCERLQAAIDYCESSYTNGVTTVRIDRDMYCGESSPTIAMSEGCRLTGNRYGTTGNIGTRININYADSTKNFIEMDGPGASNGKGFGVSHLKLNFLSDAGTAILCNEPFGAGFDYLEIDGNDFVRTGLKFTGSSIFNTVNNFEIHECRVGYDQSFGNSNIFRNGRFYDNDTSIVVTGKAQFYNVGIEDCATPSIIVDGGDVSFDRLLGERIGDKVYVGHTSPLNRPMIQVLNGGRLEIYNMSLTGGSVGGDKPYFARVEGGYLRIHGGVTYQWDTPIIRSDSLARQIILSNCSVSSANIRDSLFNAEILQMTNVLPYDFGNDNILSKPFGDVTYYTLRKSLLDTGILQSTFVVKPQILDTLLIDNVALNSIATNMFAYSDVFVLGTGNWNNGSWALDAPNVEDAPEGGMVADRYILGGATNYFRWTSGTDFLGKYILNVQIKPGVGYSGNSVQVQVNNNTAYTASLDNTLNDFQHISIIFEATVPDTRLDIKFPGSMTGDSLTIANAVLRPVNNAFPNGESNIKIGYTPTSGTAIVDPTEVRIKLIDDLVLDGNVEITGNPILSADNRGTATVTGVDGGQTTASITFTNTKDDATYYVATSVSINTGTPSGDELRVVVANKATTGFDLILQDGLEGGEVVDMDWILIE